jgi:hypothetical protein
MNTMSEAIESTLAARERADAVARPSIDDIREAMHRMHRLATGQSDRAYMSIPADPKRDADLILSAAIDELWTLRRRVMEIGAELATAANVARALGEERERAQLAATEAEIRAEMAAQRIAELEANLREEREDAAALDLANRGLGARLDAVREVAGQSESDSATEGAFVEEKLERAEALNVALVAALEDVLNRPMVEAEGTNPLVVTIHIAAERVEKWRDALRLAWEAT